MKSLGKSDIIQRNMDVRGDIHLDIGIIAIFNVYGDIVGTHGNL